MVQQKSPGHLLVVLLAPLQHTGSGRDGYLALTARAEWAETWLRSLRLAETPGSSLLGRQEMLACLCRAVWATVSRGISEV